MGFRGLVELIGTWLSVSGIVATGEPPITCEPLTISVLQAALSISTSIESLTISAIDVFNMSLLTAALDVPLPISSITVKCKS